MSLSDAEQAELNQLEGEVGHLAPPPAAAPETSGGGLSDSEKVEMASLEKEVGHLAPSEGFIDSAGRMLSAVGKTIDSYSGAPTRAAVGAVQDGKSPVDAFKNQFGENPELAPTGPQIASKMGVSDKSAPTFTAQQQYEAEKKYDPNSAEFRKSLPQSDPRSYRDINSPSPAAVVGTGINLAADPMNLIPLAGEAKSLLRGGEAAADIVSKPGILESAGNKLKSFAEDAAVNATGATGKQASEFAPGAGRELLDRGLVRFGDSQKKIAQRVSAAADEANSRIDEALGKLQAQGVTVDRNAIYNTVRKTINDMKADESKADVANLLEKHLDNVVSAADAGGTQVPITQAEQIKRGFKRQAGNWMDPEKGQAGKTMYQAYRGAVEDAARAASPATEAAFEEGKKTYGLLTPIQEAAERRALTAGQHQAGGLLDIGAMEVGERALGPVGVAITPIARRVISPRIASSIATGTDAAGDMLKAAPALDKSAAPLAAVSKLPIENLYSIPRAADQNQAPTKGPAKWANDGMTALMQHAQGPDRDLIAQNANGLMADQKGRDLLIKASDLKPGTKAMDNLLDRVKTHLKGD